MATSLIDAVTAGQSYRAREQAIRGNELQLQAEQRAQEQRPMESRLAQIALGQRQGVAPGTPGMKAEPQSQQSALMELVALNPEMGAQIQQAGFKLAADAQTRAENQAKALAGFLQSIRSLPLEQRIAARDAFLQNPVAQAMVDNPIMQRLSQQQDFSNEIIDPLLASVGGRPEAPSYEFFTNENGERVAIDRADPTRVVRTGQRARPTAAEIGRGTTPTARAAPPSRATASAPQVRPTVLPPPKLRPVPVKALDAITQNRLSIGQLDRAIALVTGQTLANDPSTPVDDQVGDREATGFKGYAPAWLLNRFDPEGVETRAAIADIGSAIIHDRSGAAVTLSEYPRLQPFIPSATDDQQTAERKLRRLRQEAIAVSRELESAYSPANGFSPLPIPAAASAAGAPAARTVPPVNSRGWRLMTDAQGNQAYVSPDGKQFEEVR